MSGSRLCAVAVWMAAALLSARSASGQAAWEYTPYQVRVRVAVAAQLPPGVVPVLEESLAARAEAAMGAIWSLQTLPAAGRLHSELVANIDGLAVEQVVGMAEADDLAGDKLYLAAISCDGGVFQVAVRELDCRSRQLGPVSRRMAATFCGLPLALWDAVRAGFTPLARIESVEQGRVVARLRAGGLVVDPKSPALVEPGMALRPVIRRNDRTGQPMKGGVQAVPWTVLAVGKRDHSLVECSIYSGYRAPIPARGGLRTERLALLVRPQADRTRLVLKARDNPAKALAGYEIHIRTPDAEQAQLVGVTDTQGAVKLPRSDGCLQIVYVRHGRQLLARLPIVAGEDAELVAAITDDDRRLEAEGFVAALVSRALDLVARREIMAARIRARLKQNQLAEAQALLDDFRKLPTRADLSRDLNQFRQRASSSDKLTQQRIEKLLADAQQLLLLRPLSDELLAQLTREVAAARSRSALAPSLPERGVR